MRLSDLLAELRDNILHDRTDQVGATTSRMWSDTTLIRYIDEAQRRLAWKGLVLRTSGPSEEANLTEITLVEGQSDYKLHEAVLAVISARYDTERQDLLRSGHTGLRGYGQLGDGMTRTAMPEGTGQPRVFTTDERLDVTPDGSSGVVSLRVYPTPGALQAGKTIHLRVVRMPIDRLMDCDMRDSPEVPEIFHIPMLDWAAYLALRVVDLDAGMPDRAHEFRKMFEGTVADARRDAQRKMFAPMSWGFGRGGFTWES